MKSRQILLAVALAGTSARAAVVLRADPKTQLKSVADRFYSTVVAVRAEAAVAVRAANADGEEVVPTASFGTGVLVGDGLAVTTLHSVGIATHGKIAAWKNLEVLVPEAGAAPAEIVAWFPDLDLAILRVRGTRSLATAPLCTEPPERGDALVAMGAGEDAVNAVGVMVAGSNGDHLLLTSDRVVDSRYWGGPLFDAQGRLAGITVPSLIPKAISSVALAALLDRVRGQ